MSWNGLGEKGGLALADSLLVNSTLTDLDISTNRLTNNVAAKFAKVIVASEALEVLKVKKFKLAILSIVHSHCFTLQIEHANESKN